MTAQVDECSTEAITCTGQFETCVNKIGEFSCQCESTGFERNAQTSDCADIDECQSYEEHCPGPFDVCVNEVGSFTCPCESTGYERLSQSADCSDVDECIASSTCPETNEECQNIQGSYICECKTGFERSEISQCIDIDECTLSVDLCPGPFDNCENNIGSFDCPCDSPGYQRASESVDCSDINECDLPEACVGCENLVGSYTCDCEPGLRQYPAVPNAWILMNALRWKTHVHGLSIFVKMMKALSAVLVNLLDTRDCLNQRTVQILMSVIMSISVPDRTNCVKTEGSYSCDCDTGFEPPSEGAACSDVDECNSATDSCLGPYERCENAVGTFSCLCETNGFSRQSPEANCDDVDECA